MNNSTKSEMPNILLTNLRSICNKFDDLCVQVLIKNPDIIICTDTWLKSDIPIEAFDLSGYSSHRTDRMGDSGRGGVMIWTKHRLHSKSLIFPSFPEAEAVSYTHLTLPTILLV